MPNINIQKYWQYVATPLLYVPAESKLLTDDFICDFNDHDIDRKSLTFDPWEVIREGATKLIYETSAKANIRLKYVETGRAGLTKSETLKCDKFKTSGGREILVQTKYLEYFRRVYPGCSFYTTRHTKLLIRVWVKHNGTCVGGVAAMHPDCLFRSIRK